VCKYGGEQFVYFVTFSEYFCDIVGICCAQKERGIILYCIKTNVDLKSLKWPIFFLKFCNAVAIGPSRRTRKNWDNRITRAQNRMIKMSVFRFIAAAKRRL